MRKMPYEIKQKLRQYAKLQSKVADMAREIDEMIEAYNVPIDNLLACGDGIEPQTEALAFLHNSECDNIEETIREIEEVFLYFANKQIEE